MAELSLKLQPLTKEAFAPFGDVIEVSDANKVIGINYGLTDRHHDLAKVDVADNNGHAIINLFNTNPITLPFTLKIMERHPFGSQAFINTNNNPYVVVVGQAGEFDHTKLVAFLAQANQGVNYHKGTWHHYCLGLNEKNVFVVVDRGGEGPNCDEAEFPDGVTVVVDH